jgi:protein gp37
MMNIEKGKFWDLPWSLVDGCTPCSPGCVNCWSAALTHRFQKNLTHSWGVQKNGFGLFNSEIVIHPERLDIPLKRRKPTVYVVWNDLFHEDVPFLFQLNTWLMMEREQRHTFLVLTKRPNKMLYFYKLLHRKPPKLSGIHVLSNLWNGLTVCTQEEADEKIPIFLQVPGRKFLSLEPLLGPVDIAITTYWDDPVAGIQAVILGGETLGNRPGREMKIEWAESIIAQCDDAGIPVFIKQLHINGKVRKNVDEWPEKLRRRELPWLKKDR